VCNQHHHHFCGNAKMYANKNWYLQHLWAAILEWQDAGDTLIIEGTGMRLHPGPNGNIFYLS